MKRFLLPALTLLLAALLIALASCRSSDPEPITSNTGPEQTYEPTAEQTYEPTAEPAEEPTAAPTEAMLPIELDFGSCAEAIVSLIPGEAEEEIHYPARMDDNPPMIYYPTEENIYIVNYDPDPARIYSTILSVNIADGSIGLIQPEKDNDNVKLGNIHANPFVIHNDTIITHRVAYNMKNDRLYDAGSPIPGYWEYASLQAMYVIGNDVYLSYAFTTEAKDRMVCRFDWESMKWGEPEQLFKNTEKNYDGHFFIGLDAEGNKYMTVFDPDAEADWRVKYVIEKYDREDRLVSSVLLPWYDDGKDGVFWEMGESSIRVTEDGTVYIMAPFTDALKVYKVNMG